MTYRRQTTLYLLLGLLLFAAPAWAIPRYGGKIYAANDTLPSFAEDARFVPESFDLALDSTFSTRYQRYYTYGSQPTGDAQTYPHEHYKQRLAQLNSAIPLPYNPVIRDCIELFLTRRSRLVSQMLAKSTYYFPIIEDILDKHNLPLELKYLAIIESALNPIAVSPRGATGLWQFMLSTGKLYGLTIDSLVDERRDPVRSTQAAAAYLKELHRIYDDWLLAIAAYNCGPGNVNKATRRAGGKGDFWRVYQYLPRETRSYVPYFIAAYYAMEYYADYRIPPAPITMPLLTDTVRLQRRHTFTELSHLAQVSVDTLKLLNPKYRRDIVPGNASAQEIILPAGKAIELSHAQFSLPDTLPVELVESVTKHVVARGESLPAIARKYGVSVKDIKTWNNLRSSKIRRGQSLKIRLLSEIPVEKEKETDPETEVAQAPAKPAQPRYHTVRRGESLSTIASKYRGVTVNRLRQLNGLKNNNLKPGQRLRLS